MENTKAKIVIIAVLITLLIVCLGVVVWQCIGTNDLSNEQSDSNSQQAIVNVKEDNESEKSEVLLEDVKTKYNYVVETAINKSQPRAAWSECGNEYLHINVVAPKINIETYNITKNNLKEAAYENINDGMDADTLENYEMRLDEIISKGEMTILDIENDRLKLYFPVDLEGLTIEI